MTFWHLWMGQEGGGTAALVRHEITIEGQCFAVDQDGVNINSMRTIHATLVVGDEAVSYIFEETEVS